jgi:hypothetical protein
MIKVIEVITPEDIEAVKGVMKDLYSDNISELFGLWENNICVGGFSVNKNPKGEFTFVVNSKSSVGIAKALQTIFGKLFKKYTQLQSRVQLANKKSIKGTAQFGARKVYIENGQQVFIFTKQLWKYQKRWPL